MEQREVGIPVPRLLASQQNARAPPTHFPLGLVSSSGGLLALSACLWEASQQGKSWCSLLGWLPRPGDQSFTQGMPLALCLDCKLLSQCSLLPSAYSLQHSSAEKQTLKSEYVWYAGQVRGQKASRYVSYYINRASKC